MAVGAATLVLIDFQAGFGAPFWGGRNNPRAEENAARLLDHWRARRWPLVHVRHLSREAGSPLAADTAGAAFIPALAPVRGEKIVEKHVNSAFIGTDLEDYLRKAGVRDLVICGLTTPHCISTTTRMAANLGFGVTLAHDACAAFARNADMSWRPDAPALEAQAIHDGAVAHLHGEFARARTTADILAADG